jgi:hypothetical protein
LRKKVYGQKKGDKPLQQRASPKTEGGAKPSEEIVTALMDDEICAIDKKIPSVGGERIDEEKRIKDKPGEQCCARDRLPGLVNDGLEVFEHPVGRFYGAGFC